MTPGIKRDRFFIVDRTNAERDSRRYHGHRQGRRKKRRYFYRANTREKEQKAGA